MTAADTECAHILLDLAYSTGTKRPTHREKLNQNIARTANIKERNVLLPLSPNPFNSKTTGTCHNIVKGSTQKLHKGRACKTNGSLSHNETKRQSKTPCQKVVRTTLAQKDVDKRIKLDHSYSLPAWASEYPKPVDPEFFNLLDQVEGNCPQAKNNSSTKINVGRPSDQKTLQSTDNSNHNPDQLSMNFYSERNPDIFLSSSENNNKHQLSPEYQPNYIENNAQHISHHVDSVRNKGDAAVCDVSDVKHKNFNLLLKCLTTCESGEERRGSRKRCYSTLIESRNSTSSDLTYAPPMEIGSFQEATCGICKKVFSDETVLRDHYRHIHQSMVLSTSTNCAHCHTRLEHVGASCHECEGSQRASESSAERLTLASNLSTCQFCGIRMRRQLLVKHLAEKHCLEKRARVAVAPQPSPPSPSESGSETTLSGSEHDDGAIVVCDICLAYVPKGLLRQHVQDKHAHIASDLEYATLDPANKHWFTENQVQSSSLSPGVEPNMDCEISAPVSTSQVDEEPYMLQRFLREHTENPNANEHIERNSPSMVDLSCGKPHGQTLVFSERSRVNRDSDAALHPGWRIMAGIPAATRPTFYGKGMLSSSTT